MRSLLVYFLHKKNLDSIKELELGRVEILKNENVDQSMSTQNRNLKEYQRNSSGSLTKHDNLLLNKNEGIDNRKFQERKIDSDYKKNQIPNKTS